MFQVKDENKDNNNKLMPWHIDGDKLLEKYKVIWTKIEDLKNSELNSLPAYDERYIKMKIGAYSGKVYTNFCVLNVLEDGLECESLTIIPINPLLVYKNKFFLKISALYQVNFLMKLWTSQW